MLVGLTVLGEKFIFLWLGEDYLPSVPLFWILGYATLLPTILLPGEELCKTFNKHGPLTIIYLFVSVLNIILTIVMVRTMGMYGAAFSTTIGLLVGNVLVSLIYYKRVLYIHIGKLLYGIFHKIIIVLFLIGITGYAMDYYIFSEFSWGVLMLEGLIMYIIFLFCMRIYGFSDSEKKIEARISSLIFNKIKRW